MKISKPFFENTKAFVYGIRRVKST